VKEASCKRREKRLGELKAAVAVERLCKGAVKMMARCAKSGKRRVERLGVLKAAVAVE
jgi:hypothetical protein